NPCPQLSGVIVHEKQEFQLFPVVIEPKLNRNLISGVIRRQGTKSVNALKSPYSRLVQRRHAAGLLNLHIARAAVASDVKGEIHAISRTDARINLILQPVLGNFLLNNLHIPGVLISKVSATTGNAKSSFGAADAERAVWTANRPALAKGNNVVSFFDRLRFRFTFGGAALGLCFLLGVLIGNRNRFRFFHFRLRLWVRLRKPLGFICEHVLGLGLTRWQRYIADQGYTHSVASASSTPIRSTTCRSDNRVAHSPPRHKHVQADGPRQVAAPALMLEEYFSVTFHANRAAA